MSRKFYIGIGAPWRNAFGPALGRRSAGGFGRFSWRAAQVFVCLGALGGCAVSIPMASLIPGNHDDETGTIAKPRLAGWLDGEDWERAKTAFSRALDAEKSGSATNWDNPASGAKGTFVAVGQAYPGDGGLCRAFHADIDRQTADDSLEGTACAGKSGEWQVTEIKPTNKS